MNQLRLRVVEISRNTGKTCFVKKVVDVQCRSTNFQFTIFSNYTIRLLFFGFLRDAISILFVSQQKTRRILNRAKEKKKNRRRKIDSFDSSG